MTSSGRSLDSRRALGRIRAALSALRDRVALSALRDRVEPDRRGAAGPGSTGSRREEEGPSPGRASVRRDGTPGDPGRVAGDVADSDSFARGAAAASGGDAAPDADAVSEVPPALPPRERIERMLATNGGRIWQSDVVEALDLSAASVSRKLSAMEEDGLVVRRKVGRRNVVMTPEEFARTAAWREEEAVPASDADGSDAGESTAGTDGRASQGRDGDGDDGASDGPSEDPPASAPDGGVPVGEGRPFVRAWRDRR